MSAKILVNFICVRGKVSGSTHVHGAAPVLYSAGGDVACLPEHHCSLPFQCDDDKNTLEASGGFGRKLRAREQLIFNPTVVGYTSYVEKSKEQASSALPRAENTACIRIDRGCWRRGVSGMFFSLRCFVFTGYWVPFGIASSVKSG